MNGFEQNRLLLVDCVLTLFIIYRSCILIVGLSGLLPCVRLAPSMLAPHEEDLVTDAILNGILRGHIQPLLHVLHG